MTNLPTDDCTSHKILRKVLRYLRITNQLLIIKKAILCDLLKKNLVASDDPIGLLGHFPC